MSISIARTMPPEAVGELIGEQLFAADAPYVHLTGLPFAELGAGAQEEYIRRAASAIGELSLTTTDPESTVWRLDSTTSANAARIPYHTDNPAYFEPEELVGFWNVHSSAQGGENVLLPVADILARAQDDPQTAKLLEDLQLTPVTFAHGGHRDTKPMLDGRGAVYFDRRYVNPAHGALADRFTALLESSNTGQAIKLGGGDVLFFKNRIQLHARQSYTDIARVSFRTRVQAPH